MQVLRYGNRKIERTYKGVGIKMFKKLYQKYKGFMEKNYRKIFKILLIIVIFLFLMQLAVYPLTYLLVKHALQTGKVIF